MNGRDFVIVCFQCGSEIEIEEIENSVDGKVLFWVRPCEKCLMDESVVSFVYGTRYDMEYAYED